jgi:hypothetical protein
MRITGCLPFLMGLSLSAYPASPSVKVLIGKSLDSVMVEGIDLFKVLHTQKTTQQYKGRRAIEFNCLAGLAEVSDWSDQLGQTKVPGGTPSPGQSEQQ